jgi:hypothetical protein
MDHPENLPLRMTWSTSHVCHALGVTQETFAKKRKELEAAGFPRKLPGINAYSIAAVKDWITTSAGQYSGAARLAIPAADAEIDAIVAELEGAYVTAPDLQQVA